jgi:hypothetical protein
MTINGTTRLDELIRHMRPALNPGAYVFCLAPAGGLPDGIESIGWFRETEGVTVILPQAAADAAGLAYTLVCAWITLQVHSDLAAVGLTAAVSTALAKAGISCNVMAGLYHDHLFVPLSEGERALQVLERLKEEHLS